jgi:hypothetical protein
MRETLGFWNTSSVFKTNKAGFISVRLEISLKVDSHYCAKGQAELSHDALAWLGI